MLCELQKNVVGHRVARRRRAKVGQALLAQQWCGERAYVATIARDVSLIRVVLKTEFAIAERALWQALANLVAGNDANQAILWRALFPNELLYVGACLLKCFLVNLKCNNTK